MKYSVSENEKLLFVWDESGTKDVVEQYRARGFSIIKTLRGDKPVNTVLRTIVMQRV